MRIARLLYRIGLVALIAALGAVLAFRHFAPEEQRAPNPPAFSAFAGQAQGSCTEDAEVSVTLRWKSTDATEAWIAMNAAEAHSDPLGVVSPTGEAVISVPCPAEETLWTVTVQGLAGIAHQSLTIRPGEPDPDAGESVLFVGAPPEDESE